MKKISTILLAFICVLSFCLVGCTYADNATLLSIEEKYSFITSDYEDFFNGDSFLPTYNSDKLLNVIHSSNEDYSVLKTNANDSVFTNRGQYGILMQSVNSTYLSMSNAMQVISNNKVINKQYKKQMYISLQNFQNDLKKLDQSKRSLESVFNNNAGDSLTIANEGLTQYNLKNYKKDLSKSLNDLLSFNKNFTLALNNNIIKPISLNDLLYNATETFVVTNNYNNMLINNFSMIASNFVLNYSVDIKQDISSVSELTGIMANLLNIQATLTSDDLTSDSIKNEYKIIRVLEDSLLKKETTLNNCIKNLNIDSFENTDVTESSAINSIEEIYNELISYGNRLMQYLENTQN